MASIVNQSPYLRTSRNFPKEIDQLIVEISRSYLDIASKMNDRTIGIFPIQRPAISGEGWFLSSQKQQTMRQVYTFKSIAPSGSVSISYTAQGFTQFSRIWGTCLTNVPDSRPLPYSSVTANANIELKIDTVNFNIIINNGSASPTINSGIVVLEWLVNP